MRIGNLRPGLFALLLLLVTAGLSSAGDTIRFKNGRSLSGRIVAEDGESVTLEIDGGGKLTVPRRDIAEIVRETAGSGGGEAESTGGAVRAEHFLVWSGTRRLGTRSLWVRKNDAGGYVLEEESTFLDAEGKEEVRVRIVETVTAALEPVEILYREIAVGGQTVRHGVVRGGALHLSVSAPGGKRESTLAMPDGVRFPLAAREFAVRERERLKGAWEVKVFDPREENFYLYRFESAGTRRVDWEGAVTEVSVLVRHRASRAPEEIWIDAAGATLSEELNGPEVVAVRTTRERIDSLLSGEDVATSAEERRVRPLHVNRDVGFQVRKPTLSWTFEPGKPGGRQVLTISNLRWFAYVDIIVLPLEPEGGLLSSLAVDMEKRFEGASENFKKLSEGFLEVGGEKAVRIVASSRNRGEELQSWLVGVLHGGRTWLIAMACPKAYWTGAEPEFQKILDGFEFLD